MYNYAVHKLATYHYLRCRMQQKVGKKTRPENELRSRMRYRSSVKRYGRGLWTPHICEVWFKNCIAQRECNEEEQLGNIMPSAHILPFKVKKRVTVSSENI